MINLNQLWVQYNKEQPFQILIQDCQNVYDIITKSKKHLNLQENIEEMCLLIMDENGIKGKKQNYEKSIQKILSENNNVGRTINYPLRIVKFNKQNNNNGTSTNNDLFSFFENLIKIFILIFNLVFILLKNLLPIIYNEILSINFITILSSIYNEILSINFITILSIFQFLYDYNNDDDDDDDIRFYNFYREGTFSLLFLQIFFYFYLKYNELLKRNHFVCSIDNINEKRYWVLITSSFCHGDVNHLVNNILSFYFFSSYFEIFFGFSNLILFFIFSSIFSSVFSLIIHGHPSVGLSGVIYAFIGVFFGESSIFEIFKFLSKDILSTYLIYSNIDYSAHVAGFIFGYYLEKQYF
jgi:membrane associated rhomboid family serine protease